MENFKAYGAKLIEELKEHIVNVVRASSQRQGLSLEELREASGLKIRAKSGENVWDKAIITLLVELVKEGRLESAESQRPLESRYAARARYSVPPIH